mmetsp:Transcript_23056/g.41645  ORF Transcript_23056/g.41645 Transcript_23056/m.41645 type:complete len:257 (+) Transcript_23056:75-845(+)|eukprot:CAMPEP_0197653990 /NCGR_PEP_ID=MMETSP1338-20131121/38137_1 /TAXON_ID=43686 ORGANISM="Pelagodinium beii, Strain RCC1491" /NCGR_SAMPLE_ID=MMETSP1338 /ASSEMBLY_ACC=CAM_ASM_000754 /LENGTH=256 /DNA_ID=CAMNT_0043229333 /DNA_START=66 /DNA_END=836 /DNA_ORIENTATION=+
MAETVEETLYEILDVDEDASTEEIIKSYRQRALTEHPDKGGDKDRFDELAKAYAVLSDAKQRATYDEQLEKDRAHADLVQGARAPYSKQQLQAPMARQKTAPTPGSRRQAAMRISQPGRPEHCAEEWKGLGSAKGILKSIADEVTPEQQTEKLLAQYVELPRGKEKKRDWTNGLRGEDKQNLKLAAKKKEAAERAKWSAWLGNGVANVKAPKAKAKSRPTKKPAAVSKEPSEAVCKEHVKVVEECQIEQTVCVEAC